MPNEQLELFAGAQTFIWQWYGRQIFIEIHNDFRFSRKLHRVVYHLADICKAKDEVEARAIFQATYPFAKTTRFFCVPPVKEAKHLKKPHMG